MVCGMQAFALRLNLRPSHWRVHEQVAHPHFAACLLEQLHMAELPNGGAAVDIGHDSYNVILDEVIDLINLGFIAEFV